jgi:phage gp46-like protein
MSDVLMHQTLDDGEITVANGTIEMTDGSETAVYLSLFGGDSVWWGNSLDTPDKIDSRTGKLLESLPLTTGNLQRIKDAVESDLSWMDKKPRVTVSMPRLNTVTITVDDIVLTWEK